MAVDNLRWLPLPSFILVGNEIRFYLGLISVDVQLRLDPCRLPTLCIAYGRETPQNPYWRQRLWNTYYHTIWTHTILNSYRQGMSFMALLMRKTSKCFVLRHSCEFHLPQEIHILQLLQISSDCSSRFSLVTWDEGGRPKKVRYFFKGAAKNIWITSCENCDLDCTKKNERKDRAIFCWTQGIVIFVRFCLTSAGVTGKAFKTAYPIRSMRNEPPARRLPKCCMLQIEPVCRESHSCRENLMPHEAYLVTCGSLVKKHRWRHNQNRRARWVKEL